MAKRRYLRAAKAIFNRHLISLVAFVSYLGGPFFIADLLMPRFGKWPALLITGTPMGLMLFGTLQMNHAYGRPSRGVLWAGFLGLVISMFMHLYAVWGLVRGLGAEYAQFHFVGIAGGILWSLVYWLQARLYLGRRGTSGVGDPSSPKPIEPS